jgi:hypothetical protein
MAVAPSDSAGDQARRPLPAALGLIGTLALCAAAMIAHLSPPQLKPVAAVLWIVGFALQAAAFIMALAGRHLSR